MEYFYDTFIFPGICYSKTKFWQQEMPNATDHHSTITHNPSAVSALR